MRPKRNMYPDPGRPVKVRRKHSSRATPVAVDGVIESVLGHKGAMVRTNDNGKVQFYRWTEITDVVTIPRRSSAKATLGDVIGPELEAKRAELKVVPPLALAPEPPAVSKPVKPVPPKPVEIRPAALQPVKPNFQKPIKPPILSHEDRPSEYSTADDGGPGLFKEAEPAKEEVILDNLEAVTKPAPVSATRKRPPAMVSARLEHFPTVIGTLIKTTRLAEKMYQHEFGPLIGLAQASLSRIELGSALPGDEVLARFAQLQLVKGITLADLRAMRDAGRRGRATIDVEDALLESAPAPEPEPSPAPESEPSPAPELPPPPVIPLGPLAGLPHLYVDPEPVPQLPPPPPVPPLPQPASEVGDFSSFLLQLTEFSPMPSGKEERARWLDAARKMWEARAR
jgi:transcriptional regulator with XRE-family HTH domain